LTCDYIGFHTYDYARHFLSACNRVLNLPTMPNAVEYKGRTVNVGTIPIGIDPEKFTDVSPRHSVFNFRLYKIQNVKIESLNSNRSSRERKLSSALIALIISKVSLKSCMPLKYSSLNILNGSERSHLTQSELIKGCLGSSGGSISWRCRRISKSSHDSQ
jgi:hypothetical protein